MRTNTSTRVIVPMSPWSGPAFGSNTTASSFASIAPTLTKPTSDSSSGAAILPAENAVIRLSLFGAGSDNNAYDIKVVGWSRVWADQAAAVAPAQPDKTVEWIPSAMAYLTATLSTSTGVASGVVGGTTQRFADTITEKSSSGYATAAINIVSPADNIPGYVEVATSGFQMIGVYFDMDTATSGNLLYANT